MSQDHNGYYVSPPVIDPGPPSVLRTLRNFRWVRGHISVFALGSVIILIANLLIQTSNMWSATVIGAWGVLVFAHVITALMAGLLLELLTDDNAPSGIDTVETTARVLPPDAKPAQLTPPQAVPTSTEPAVQSPTIASTDPRVSWRIATDAAQLNPSHSSESDTESRTT